MYTHMQHRHRRPRFSFTTWVLFTVIRVLCFTSTSTDYWMLGRTKQNMWGCHKELFCAILKHFNDLIINIITDQLWGFNEPLHCRVEGQTFTKSFHVCFGWTRFKDLKVAHEHGLSSKSCRSVTLFVKLVKLSTKKWSDNVQNLI